MILNILIPLAGLCIVCFLGPKLLGFFMPFVIGWIIALIANPLVKFLERHLKLVRRHGSMVIIVGVLILVIGLLYLAVVWTYTEMAGFVKDLPLLYDNALSEITEAIENSRKLVTYLPDSSRNRFLKSPIIWEEPSVRCSPKQRLPQWRLREMWQKAFRTSW